MIMARRIAEPYGPLHTLWDIIFDAEAILSGGKPLLTREQVEEELLRLPEGA